MEDYFPASRNSSTPVKLAACLAEVSTIWSASGCAILTGVPGGGTLSLSSARGVELPKDLAVPAGGASLTARCFRFGKNRVVGDLSLETEEFLPGVKAASAACVTIKSGTSASGVLLLWSDVKEHFAEKDLVPLSLFGYYVAMIRDVDELGEKLGENLMIDPLTGLHNRRQFDHRIHQEVSRAERYTLNVSLVILDIDHLDEYNSSCGHMLGNLALSDIASILEKGTREVDFVARIGGDEFACILPETNRLGAVRVAERLRSEVAAYPFPIPDDQAAASLTVTGGIASCPGSASNEHELLAKAFQALELAKKEGANNVKLWKD